ncbi:MAG: rod shape-determining protein MreD [Lachnospiraceae bacterium]|jgi:rod shape-determining protein MreD|nr:rod shape-determining protein MreD [Lachnospiraceae bacterium]MDD6666593.1 rod shape-determining protein MreD [Lachnospiraceae bacterium]
MKITYFIRRAVICLLLIAALYILQTAVFSHLELAGVVPNLLLALVALTGFMRGRKEGMVVGMAAGLLLDTFSGQLFGIYALLFLLLGYLNGVVRQVFFGDDIKLPVLFVGLTDIVYGICVYLISFASRGRTDFRFFFFNVMLPEAVYTIVISFVLYPLLQWIAGRTDRYESKGDRRF